MLCKKNVKYVLSLGQYVSIESLIYNLFNLIWLFLCGILALKRNTWRHVRSQTYKSNWPSGPSKDPCDWLCSSFFTESQGLGMLGVTLLEHINQGTRETISSWYYDYFVDFYSGIWDSVNWSSCFGWSMYLIDQSILVCMFLIFYDMSKANKPLKSTWNDSLSSLIDQKKQFTNAPGQS